MTQKDLHVLNGFFIKGLPHVFGATSRRGVIRVEVYVEVYVDVEVSLKFTLKFTLSFTLRFTLTFRVRFRVGVRDEKGGHDACDCATGAKQD